MEQRSRLYNSLRNLFFGAGNQIAVLILQFISRTVFIKTLGAEYLGINGLFTNVLTVLSLAELGFGNAIIYSMYKPLAKKDERKLAALMQFYKKIYNIIGIIIFIIGLILIPFLDVLVKTDSQIPNLTLYFILFLANTSFSYFFAYKSSIINADQKMYLVKLYTLIFNIIQTILQIIILLLTHNYILYLILQLLGTLGTNIYIAYKANKMYPFIKKNEELRKKEKFVLFQNVKSMFIFKFSNVILNSTPNIVISAMIGTIWVGYYSNYNMITNCINTAISIIFNAVTASVGNLHTENNRDKQVNVFSLLNFMAFVLFSIFSVGLIVLSKDVIELWIGKEYILNNSIVIAIVISFYINGMLNPMWVFRDTTGLFRDVKYISIFTAILNIILSILLGLKLGLLGILIATPIAKLLTIFWYQPYMLYKKIFQRSSRRYFTMQFKFLIVLLLMIFVSETIINQIHGVSMLNFIIKGILMVAICSIIIIIAFYKDESFKNAIDYVKKLLGKLKNKIKV